MTKWIFVVLVFLSTSVQANGLSPAAGGCVVYDEIIYEDVTAAGWGITGADLVFTNFQEPSVVVCTNTNGKVSGAFSRGMRTESNDVALRSRSERRSGNAGDVGRIGGRSQHFR